MTTIRIALAATALLAAGFAQASEISNFPMSASTSHVSRAAVRAQAQAANNAGDLRYDFVGPTVTPHAVPSKSRDDVRREASMQSRHDAQSASDFVGGM